MPTVTKIGTATIIRQVRVVRVSTPSASASLMTIPLVAKKPAPAIASATPSHCSWRRSKRMLGAAVLIGDEVSSPARACCKGASHHLPPRLPHAPAPVPHPLTRHPRTPRSGDPGGPGDASTNRDIAWVREVSPAGEPADDDAV